MQPPNADKSRSMIGSVCAQHASNQARVVVLLKNFCLNCAAPTLTILKKVSLFAKFDTYWIASRSACGPKCVDT